MRRGLESYTSRFPVVSVDLPVHAFPHVKMQSATFVISESVFFVHIDILNDWLPCIIISNERKQFAWQIYDLQWMRKCHNLRLMIECICLVRGRFKTQPPVARRRRLRAVVFCSATVEQKTTALSSFLTVYFHWAHQSTRHITYRIDKYTTMVIDNPMIDMELSIFVSKLWMRWWTFNVCNVKENNDI